MFNDFCTNNCTKFDDIYTKHADINTRLSNFVEDRSVLNAAAEDKHGEETLATSLKIATRATMENAGCDFIMS